MKAAVLYAKNDIRYDDFQDPVIKDDQVLVNVKACGICGSDIPRVLGDASHFFPNVLGHEFSGVVTEVGKSVTRIKVGDRVSVAPLVPCMKCDDCIQGNYAQCKHYSFIGSRQQGAFAEYVAVDERNVVPFDDDVSFEQGALFEPSTVGLHGVLQANYQGGKDVAILGGGNIGLFTMQWAKILGARTITVFDIDNDRLELAKKLGADYAVNTSEKDHVEKAMALTNGVGFGYVFDTAGVMPTMKLSFEIAANKSDVCYIGTPTREVVFDHQLFEKMHRKEFNLTGSWMSYSAPFPGKEWELTAHFFKKGILKYEGMIYKKMPLSECKEAFEMFKTPGLVKGKILLMND